MKIFISSDMEGTAGVVDWDQCIAGGAQYPYYTELLTGEINAAIEGAMQAGATEFLVNDAHSKMANLRPDALAGRAGYLSGRYKPMYMMQGLDASFDAIFLVSYHGSMGSEGSVLSHTYFPTRVRRGHRQRRGRGGGGHQRAGGRAPTGCRSCWSPATPRPPRRPGGSARASRPRWSRSRSRGSPPSRCTRRRPGT